MGWAWPSLTHVHLLLLSTLPIIKKIFDIILLKIFVPSKIFPEQINKCLPCKAIGSQICNLIAVNSQLGSPANIQTQQLFCRGRSNQTFFTILPSLPTQSPPLKYLAKYPLPSICSVVVVWWPPFNEPVPCPAWEVPGAVRKALESHRLERGRGLSHLEGAGGRQVKVQSRKKLCLRYLCVKVGVTSNDKID